YGTVRYQGLIDEHAGAGALADVAHLSRDPYGHDPFGRAREALLADVAAYAQGTYDPVIVFDGAGNLSEDRPDFSSAGVRIVFSRTGESADTVIERLVTRARHENRDVLLVTSDNAIRFTVGGVPVTSISSQLLATDLGHVDRDVETAREERSHGRMTLEDRLSPEAREKLRKLMGR
ncbi:MAG: NYN domain-containing protein, partial [Coriobacteriales bacterium]|nr:NYN domain-containing protein [Coriobacteriales bacterium]